MAFKSSMSNYYHEARAQQRKLKEITESNKRRAEQRAEAESAVVSGPLAAGGYGPTDQAAVARPASVLIVVSCPTCTPASSPPPVAHPSPSGSYQRFLISLHA
jgi:hypothetical protein